MTADVAGASRRGHSNNFRHYYTASDIVSKNTLWHITAYVVARIVLAQLSCRVSGNSK